MPMKRFDVEVPDGHHLGYSRGTDGARRAHLFRDNTNELTGHAELFEVEEEWCPTANHRYDRVGQSMRAAEPNPEVVAMINAFFEWLSPYADAAAVRAGERLRNWWLDTAVPACISTARSTWSKVTDRRKAAPTAKTSEAAALVVGGSDSPFGEAAVAVPPSRPATSSHAANARRMAALLEADPSLLEEFAKVFPGVVAGNNQPAGPSGQQGPTLRLVAG